MDLLLLYYLILLLTFFTFPTVLHLCTQVQIHLIIGVFYAHSTPLCKEREMWLESSRWQRPAECRYILWRLCFIRKQTYPTARGGTSSSVSLTHIDPQQNEKCKPLRCVRVFYHSLSDKSSSVLSKKNTCASVISLPYPGQFLIVDIFFWPF